MISSTCTASCPIGSTSLAGSSALTNCKCSGQYQGPDGGPCTQRSCSLCQRLDSCFDYSGAAICGSYIAYNSLRPYDFVGSIDATTGAIVLNSTSGGQQLEISVVIGATPIIRQLRYGPNDDPYKYNCTITFTQSLPIRIIRCRVSSGFGGPHSLSLQSCDATGTTCWWSGADNSTFTYPVVTVQGGTIRFPPALSTGATTIETANILSTTIAFDGTNFLPRRDTMQVFYGPVTSPLLYSCDLDETTSTSTTVVCQTASYATGSDLVFTVVMAGHQVTGTDTISYPLDVPVITGISGCPLDITFTNATSNCPTSGGVTVSVTGRSFLTPLAVFINGNGCTSLRVISTELVTCSLPAGTGYEQAVTVNSREQFSAPAPLVSYAQPSITSLRGCSPTASPTSTGECHRSGGQILTIEGLNFGISQASILLGASSCLNVRHDSVTPHTLLYCELPHGNRLDRSVVVFQRRGELSSTEAFVHYTQCHPGQFEIGFDCFACPTGKYTNTDAKLSCESCESGYYAANEQSTVCTSCDAGKYSLKSTTSGASSCIDCEAATFSAASAATCTACETGTASNQTGIMNGCPACEAGFYASSTRTKECLPCPAGSISLDGATQCVPCPSGSAQSLIAQSSCSSCIPGKFASTEGSIQCDDCDTGKFASQPSSQECSKCVIGKQIAPFKGSSQCYDCPITSQTFDSMKCSCNVGYYSRTTYSGSNSLSVECVACPDGANCGQVGTSWETLQTSTGWWRSSNESTSFIQCLRSAHCIGGSSECGGNREGTLCAICKRGYQATSIDSACEPCPSENAGIGYTILFALLLLFGLGILYWLALRTGGSPLLSFSKDDDDTSSVSSSSPPGSPTGPKAVDGTAKIVPPLVSSSSLSNLAHARRGSGRVSMKEFSRDLLNLHQQSSLGFIIHRETLNDLARQSDESAINPTLIVMRKEHRVAPSFTYTLKIAVGFFQVASTLTGGLEIGWPSYFRSFISVFNM
jgi:hypothetical protein